MNDTTLPILQDIQSRQQHLDKQHLEILATARQLEDKVKSLDARLVEITNDHGEVKRQAAEALKLPADNTAKIQELEARIRTCEGAIGAPAHPESQPAPDPMELAPPEHEPPVDHAKSKHKAHHR